MNSPKGETPQKERTLQHKSGFRKWISPKGETPQTERIAQQNQNSGNKIPDMGDPTETRTHPNSQDSEDGLPQRETPQTEGAYTYMFT